MGALIIAEKIEPGITRIVLNDPDARNAMSDEMAVLFEQEVSRCAADPDLRVVIVTGAGQAFSAGGHLEMLLEKSKRSKDDNIRGMLDFYHRFLSISSLPVPVIAAINGHAVGAGLCMALSCDIRIAASGAKFGLNFVQIGLHPGMGATYFLPRLVGPATAAELLYSGRIFAAEEALSSGIVNRVVEADRLNEVVVELARTIALAGPQAVRALKKSLSVDVGQLGQCLEREAAAQAEDYSGPQFAEGIRAAMEKRKAKF